MPNSLKEVSQLEASLEGLVGVSGISLSFGVCAGAHRGRHWAKLCKLETRARKAFDSQLSHQLHVVN